MRGVLVIPINLNEIHYETNYLKMIVQKKVLCFKYIHEWKISVVLSKSLINLLIYDGRTLYIHYQNKIHQIY